MAASETVRALRAAVRGLLYPSESDRPLKVAAWTGTEVGAERVTADVVRRLCRVAADAPVEEKGLEEFFGPVTAERDWYGEEEKATAARFRELERVVKERLRDVKVFRWGGPTADLLLVGRDPQGDFAGVRTKVVET